MKNRRHIAKILICIFFLLMVSSFIFAQSNTLQIRLKNEPENFIFIGKLKGDKFIQLDTIQVHSPDVSNSNSATSVKTANFMFAENAEPGMYRLILGQTTYAKVMNEPPQQIDFIFNNNNLLFETDFKAPEDSLRIIQSEENKVWFEFLKKEKVFQKDLKITEMELEYFRESGKQTETENAVEKYNAIQQKRNLYISNAINENPDYFSVRLIKLFREPFLDGNLSKQKRNKIFKKEYLNNIDFEDKSLLNSKVFTDRIFNYLMHFAEKGLTREQQEREFETATDTILAAIKQVNSGFELAYSNEIYEFVLDYLVRGFEKLKLENVINYIAENYSGTTCQTDEKTTLERKLEATKMKVGTLVSDFEMNDINGDLIRLSEIQKDTTLLVFWASWCPHCVEMLPEIRRHFQNSASKNYEIIAVSLDTSKTEWQNFVYENKLESFYNVCDFKEWNGEVVENYNIYATPTFFIIDLDRKILAIPITINDIF